MALGSILSGAASVVGGVLGADAAGDASKAQLNATKEGIAEQRRQFNTALGLQAPAINTGNVARSTLAGILGLNVPGSEFTVGGTTPPQGSGRRDVIGRVGMFGRVYGVPGQGDQPTQTGGTTFTSPAATGVAPSDLTARLEAMPGFQFAVDQARRAAGAQASAAGVSSVGGNAMTALGNHVAGNIAMPAFESYLNRLAALSGTGQTASSGAANAAIQTGGSIADLLGRSGDARTSGILGRTNAILGSVQGVLGALGSRGSGGGGNAAVYNVGNANPWLLGGQP